mmetsp:Transcript_37994/g.105723  ORF Transcript_37994/g.105723 Transcript_37994/m.105723 type:complete len:207 (+) Transcript_37994:30-650(+)
MKPSDSRPPGSRAWQSPPAYVPSGAGSPGPAAASASTAPRVWLSGEALRWAHRPWPAYAAWSPGSGPPRAAGPRAPRARGPDDAAACAPRRQSARASRPPTPAPRQPASTSSHSSCGTVKPAVTMLPSHRRTPGTSPSRAEARMTVQKVLYEAQATELASPDLAGLRRSVEKVISSTGKPCRTIACTHTSALAASSAFAYASMIPL